MPATTVPSRRRATFKTDDLRWQAVETRNELADGAFFYSVRTTGIFCRPTCPSRLPRRANVRFHATAAEAMRAGFRPCLRCKPDQPGSAQQAELVAKICRAIEAGDGRVSLAELAERFDTSRSHLLRVFKSTTGLTIRKFSAAKQGDVMRRRLLAGESVTSAAVSHGSSWRSQVYDSAAKSFGMAPGELRRRGAGTQIHFGVGECSLGSILVAATKIGICWISLGDDPETLVREFQDTFSQAELLGGNRSFERLMARAIALVERPTSSVDLPLDIQGTLFQRRVWQLLLQLSAGERATYAQLAQRLGMPQGTRAVASACAANKIAIAIPCHRVVRSDGSLAGYRWGIERKAELLARESRTTKSR